MSDEQQPEGGFTQIGDVLGGLFAQMKAAQPESLTPETKLPVAKEKKEKQPSAQIVKAAAEIAARPDKTEFAFMARPLIQCTLPHSDPGPVPVWVRKNGDFALVLQPAYDVETMQPYGLPCGSIPRLLLFWIVTEACRVKNSGSKTRRIELGDTLSEFLRRVGLNPNTGRGKRGDAKRLKEQMMRLFRCRISFEYNAKSGRQSWVDMQVAPEAEMWWDYKSPDQASFFESYIILGERFFEAITTHAVPVDFRALKALKKSPLALDLYAWLIYRVHTLKEKKQPEVRIPLDLLQQQFGAHYTRVLDFKKAIIPCLFDVQQFIPELDYTIEKNTLVLRGSKQAAIPKRPSKALTMGKEMSQQVSEKVRDRFAQRYPLHNVGEALAAFYEWRDGKEIESINADAHFWDFVKNHYFQR